ncbi:MAG: PLDc_N domain-containing protein [Taibaiella sp.]|nr:PLDc_N domain-containing protein [Taibaiella sp.]
MTLINSSLSLSLWMIAGLVLLVLPFMALVHMFRSNMQGQDRLTWVLLVLFMPVLGSVLYFVIGRKRAAGV